MGKNPLIKELPELVDDIDASEASPIKKFETCFGENTGKVHTYFGCGRNTTAIHWDPSENLAAVLYGKKTYWLFPPTDADCLYPTGLPSFANSGVPPFLHT